MKFAPKLFLDLDGTIADFVARATQVLGQHPDEFEALYGSGLLWRLLRDYRDDRGRGFFESLDFMPDGKLLLDSFMHVGPTILTGSPFGRWAPEQKEKWQQANAPKVPIIVCMAKDKIQHIESPGDVLVDDKTKFRDVWVKGGGIFVHHTSARETIEQLRELVPIWFQRTDRWTPPRGL